MNRRDDTHGIPADDTPVEDRHICADYAEPLEDADGNLARGFVCGRCGTEWPLDDDEGSTR
jgi:hypothetical protein